MTAVIKANFYIEYPSIPMFSSTEKENLSFWTVQ